MSCPTCEPFHLMARRILHPLSSPKGMKDRDCLAQPHRRAYYISRHPAARVAPLPAGTRKMLAVPLTGRMAEDFHELGVMGSNGTTTTVSPRQIEMPSGRCHKAELNFRSDRAPLLDQAA